MAVCLCVLALEDFCLGPTGTSDAFLYGPLILRSIFKDLTKLLFWVRFSNTQSNLTLFSVLR